MATSQSEKWQSKAGAVCACVVLAVASPSVAQSDPEAELGPQEEILEDGQSSIPL